jgi:hypothetical protein
LRLPQAADARRSVVFPAPLSADKRDDLVLADVQRETSGALITP